MSHHDPEAASQSVGRHGSIVSLHLPLTPRDNGMRLSGRTEVLIIAVDFNWNIPQTSSEKQKFLNIWTGEEAKKNGIKGGEARLVRDQLVWSRQI